VIFAGVAVARCSARRRSAWVSAIQAATTVGSAPASSAMR
jgi:hypothetical protein